MAVSKKTLISLAVVAFVALVAAGATAAAASPEGTSGVLVDDVTANETTVDVEFVGTVTDQGTVTVGASGVTDNGTPVDGVEATVTVGGEVATTATVTDGELSAEFDPGVLDLAPTDSAEVGLQGYTVADPATVEVVHEAFELNASTRLRSVPQGAELAAENVTAVTVWDAAAGTYDSVTSPDFETAADFHQGLYISIGGSDARVGYTFDTTASEAGTVALSTGWNFASSNFNISQTTNLTVQEDLDLVSGNVSDLDIFTADFSQQLAPDDTVESFDGYWVFVEDGDQPVERNATDPGYDRDAREDVLGIAEGSVSLSDQATASSTFTGANPSTPGVVVEAEADVEGAVVVTYQNGSDLVIAGLDTFNESELDGSEVTVPVTEFGGFPGNHTAHVIPVDDLSSSYTPGDTVSSVTADAILDNEQATVFQGTVEFANQTAPDGIAENDTLATLDTADLLDGATNDTAFTVDVHPTDENGALVGAEFVGSSDVLTGANDNVTVTAERVPGSGEFNEFPLTRNDSYVAMIHLVDDSASAGDPAAPGQYPALRHASENGTVPGGVTDQGRIAFPAGSLINGTVTASGDTVNTDQAAGEPVSGANVTLYSGNSTDPADEVANTTTSQNGEYAFIGLSTGTYTVEPSDEEFVTESALLAVGVNETVTEEFALDYAAAGNVSGEIGLDAVDPDEAVTVTVTVVGTGNSTTVSLAGSENPTTYTIPDVDVNVGDGYTVSATSDSGNYTDPADAENVTVDVGATTTGVDFGFTRQTGGANGTVVASGETVSTTQTPGTGEGIENATISAYAFQDSDSGSPTFTFENATDLSGVFDLSTNTFPVGDHFVVVNATNFSSVGLNVTVTEGKNGLGEIALNYADTGGVSGEITLDTVDSGEDVNLTVTVTETGNATTETLAGGANTTTYTISDVDVNVDDGYTVSASSDSPSYDDPADAENVTVDVGTTTTGVDFGFTRRTGDLNGTVTNGIGSAIEGATVEVFRFGSDGPLVANDTTDASGAYSIPDLPVGDHFVTVSVDGAVAGETNATILSNQTTSANFTLDAANFTVATDGDLVGVAGETQTATVTVENIGDLPGEQTVELDWGNGTYTNSTSVALDGDAETVTSLSVTTDPNQGLGSYNVTVTSENETNESKSLVSPTRSLNQTEVSPGGTVNVTVSGQLAEEDTVAFQDAWSPAANDSAIISISVDFLFSVTTDSKVQLASGNPVGPGPLEIVYEVYLPDDVEQGTVYEWEPLESDNKSALEVGGDDLPVLGDQSFQITNLTSSAEPSSVSTPLDESTQTLAAEGPGSPVMLTDRPA